MEVITAVCAPFIGCAIAGRSPVELSGVIYGVLGASGRNRRLDGLLRPRAAVFNVQRGVDPGANMQKFIYGATLSVIFAALVAGARSLIQIKLLALSGTALCGSSENGISNRVR
jgi:hypothetical protein